ncbi:MAG TPA: hypothetical protein VK943_19020, partial [Arenibaculum sp.]|nr:hypothetical protein [Arenibaculum sp.]
MDSLDLPVDPDTAELDAAAKPAWDRFVTEHPGATLFHRAAWKTAIERSLGHRCHFLYAHRGGTIAGILPLVHVRSRLF